MLDIVDKNKKVVAVIMDDGRVVKKSDTTDNIDDLVKEQLEISKKKGKI